MLFTWCVPKSVDSIFAHDGHLSLTCPSQLNDIISLAIGLWAVVAAQKATTDEFTFGVRLEPHHPPPSPYLSRANRLAIQWVRAEILGAFFNAVFLIALCVSIILEAVTRFVDPPEIENPQLILIVGCAGLFSNLVGFVVLGGHGHSHGPGGHDHGHAHEHGHSHAHGDAEHGHIHSHGAETTSEAADENRGPAGVLPEAVVRKVTESSEQSAGDNAANTPRRIRFESGTSSRDESNTRGGRTSAHPRGRDRRRSSKSGHSRLASFEDMSIHPASFRQDIIAASKAASSAAEEPISESDSDVDGRGRDDSQDATEQSPLLKNAGADNGTLTGHSHGGLSNSKKGRSRRDSSVHVGHNHTLPKEPAKGGHGHNHGDMGMNAMVLHVIGDALGNVGVIVTALIVWLTDWPGRFYADPAVSLFITAIILKTSIPLTRATSKVLLQATPEHISISEIRQDIEALPGVVSCHHIHVWQLSDTKVVASMHLQVAFPIDSHSGEKYMELAKRARKCLHGFGIHSATIQPEFCLDQKRYHAEAAHPVGFDGADGTLGEANPDICLLECTDDCAEDGCCPGQDSSSRGSSTHHGSDDGHNHDGPHQH